MPAPFNIHHTFGCPPWLTPKGGNGRFNTATDLKWKSVGDAGRFTLEFRDDDGNEGWPFSNTEPTWPVDQCEGTWTAGSAATFKYDVIMEGDEDNRLDPMLVFDSVQRRWSSAAVFALAITVAILGFVIGRTL